MNENFNYKEVPKNYTHCLNAQCPRSAECLRFKAACHADQRKTSLVVVNPAYVANAGECQFFQPIRFVRFARGITQLLNNLPHTQHVRIRKMLYNHFNKNVFYLILNKQRLIKPKEQDFIRKLFINEEIAVEPVFDEYIELYDWE